MASEKSLVPVMLPSPRWKVPQSPVLLPPGCTPTPWLLSSLRLPMFPSGEGQGPSKAPGTFFHCQSIQPCHSGCPHSRVYSSIDESLLPSCPCASCQQIRQGKGKEGHLASSLAPCGPGWAPAGGVDGGWTRGSVLLPWTGAKTLPP